MFLDISIVVDWGEFFNLFSLTPPHVYHTLQFYEHKNPGIKPGSWHLSL